MTLDKVLHRNAFHLVVLYHFFYNFPLSGCLYFLQFSCELFQRIYTFSWLTCFYCPFAALCQARWSRGKLSPRGHETVPTFQHRQGSSILLLRKLWWHWEPCWGCGPLGSLLVHLDLLDSVPWLLLIPLHSVSRSVFKAKLSNTISVPCIHTCIQ